MFLIKRLLYYRADVCRRYFPYYIPALAWIPQYRWRHLQGDLVAAITMASFYIPMALSLASNLAHVPAINGLYSFVFNPVSHLHFSWLIFIVTQPPPPAGFGNVVC